MSDDVRRWSEELARDPGSRVFLRLGELLRRRGDLPTAQRVALRGLERHAHDAEAHDLLARVYADMGEGERARDEWEMALAIAPAHQGALRGIGFLLFAEDRLEEAEAYLARAAAHPEADEATRAALQRVREATDAARATAGPLAATALTDGRYLFSDVLGDGEHTAVLLDTAGTVLAGEYVLQDGRDVATLVGAELCGVSEEARRAMRHLGLGAWQALVFETEVARMAMAPAAQECVTLVAAHRDTAPGFLRRTLDRAADRAAAWLGGGR